MREETRRRVCGCKITVDLDDPSYRAVLESMCPACVEKLGRIEAQAAARAGEELCVGLRQAATLSARGSPRARAKMAAAGLRITPPQVVPP